MDLTRLLVFVAVGLVLFAANWAYVKSVYRTFRPEPTPSLIAPFQVIGGEADPARGATLAHLLVARLGDVEQQMDRVREALRQTRENHANALRQDRSVVDHLSIAPKIFVPLNFEVRVGGVEVGGVIAWVQRHLARDSMLQVSVHLSENGGRVGGNWIGQNNRPFLAELDSTSHDAIVDAVAFEIAYRTFVAEVEEARALTAKELQRLLSGLVALVDLEERAQGGRKTEEREYEAVLQEIEGIVAKAPGWYDLQLLAADVAEHAGDKARAAALYATVLDGEGAEFPGLQAKLAALEEEVVKEAEYTAAAQASDPGPTLPTGEREPTLLPAERRILELLGVADRQMPRSVLVALPGVPEQVAPGDLVQGRAQTAEHLSDYVDKVTQVARLVAPDVRFAFRAFPAVSRGQSSFNDLARASRALFSSEPVPEILFLPYGPLPEADFMPLFEQLAERGVITVVTAGNDPGRPLEIDGSSPQNGVLVAAATDLEGRRAPFSQYGPGCVWAPGATVPVRLPSGEVRAESGTAYSAALVVGMVARILSERPGAQPAEVIAALGERAVTRVDGGPKILDLEATLAQLSAR